MSAEIFWMKVSTPRTLAPNLHATFCPSGCLAEVARYRASLLLEDAASPGAALVLGSDIAMST